MRRKTERELRREYAHFLILGIVCILVGILMLTLPLMHPRDAREYTEEQVVISQFDHFYGGVKGASYDYIITEDGEKFNIVGDYDAAQLKETLSAGTQATLLYSTNRILPFKKYAHELSVDGRVLVACKSRKPIAWTGPIIFCTVFCLLGLAFFAGFHAVRKRNRSLQAKRDARILRKYGRLKQ